MYMIKLLTEPSPVNQQSLRKNRDLESHRYTSLAFEEIAKMVEKCATEHYFPHPEGKDDCDFCPARAACKKFWGEYAINLADDSNKYSKSKYSLQEAIHKFNQIHSLKKEVRNEDFKKVLSQKRDQ